jgi:hypothetical protein
MTVYTIHTSTNLCSYAPAFIPDAGSMNHRGDEVWDFAKLMRYIGGDIQDSEVGLIRNDMARYGCHGRIAIANDGREVVVYRVEYRRSEGPRFFLSDEPLRTYDYLMPKETA